MDNRNDRLLTVKEAKTSLGISTTTLYKLMNAGRIRARKLLYRTMISESEIARFKAEMPEVELRGNYDRKAA